MPDVTFFEKAEAPSCTAQQVQLVDFFIVLGIYIIQAEHQSPLRVQRLFSV